MKTNFYFLMLIVSIFLLSCEKDNTKPVDNYETLKIKVNASYNVDLLLGQVLKEKNELFDSLRTKKINFVQFKFRHKNVVEKLIAIDNDILKLKEKDIKAILDKTGLKRRTAQNSILFAESTNADLWQDCIDVCYIILGHKLDAIEIDLITADADYDAELAFYFQQCIIQYPNPNYSEQFACQNYAAGIAWYHLQAAYQDIADDQDQAYDEWVNCEYACDAEYGN